jgi:hypothetical protein
MLINLDMLCAMTSMLEIYILVCTCFFLIYTQNLCQILHIIPAIQKTDFRQSSGLNMAGFGDALRPEKFSGVHFKRWSVKVRIWLTTMNVFWECAGRPEGTLLGEDESRFTAANTLFVGCILSVLADRLCDVTCT